MSSLWDQAMRAAIYCNASGAPPESRAEAAARRKREATFCLDYFDYGFECDQPKGHEGDHLAHDEEYHDHVWELRWRAKG